MAATVPVWKLAKPTINREDVNCDPASL